MKGNNDLIPTIQTIFSPLAQAKNLAGQERLINHIRKYPEEVTHGLATLTVITIDFISEISKLGVDGIFLAVQFGQSQLLSHEEFLRFETPYSLQVLDNARGFWLNMLHLHGDNVYFDSVIDWPVQIINWHDKHTPPSLQEGLRHFPGSVCGGLRRWETMVLGTPASVTDEVNEALDASKGTRTIIGSGCVLPIVTPSTNIFAARQAVATYSL